jgi:hypothetical protein
MRLTGKSWLIWFFFQLEVEGIKSSSWRRFCQCYQIWLLVANLATFHVEFWLKFGFGFFDFEPSLAPFHVKFWLKFGFGFFYFWPFLATFYVEFWLKFGFWLIWFLALFWLLFMLHSNLDLALACLIFGPLLASFHATFWLLSFRVLFGYFLCWILT